MTPPPDWLVSEGLPPGVRAVVTTRTGGVSTGCYASLNLGDHVGDDAAHVAENRSRLSQTLDLPSEPRWLRQVHGKQVAVFTEQSTLAPPVADAAVTCESGVVLAVLTADCLPVLIVAKDGSAIGVAHAGWRGLAVGVIEAALATLNRSADELAVWLGPAIGAANYEVDATVRDAFADAPGFETALQPAVRAGHWHCNLAALARARLQAAGVTDIAGGAWDTFAESERFYSFRREGQTGRMASLIWLTDQ